MKYLILGPFDRKRVVTVTSGNVHIYSTLFWLRMLVEKRIIAKLYLLKATRVQKTTLRNNSFKRFDAGYGHVHTPYSCSGSPSSAIYN